MMNAISDEMLMAYADGELDERSAEQLRAACEADPQLAARLTLHRQLRQRIGAVHRGVLDEPVPDRLLQATRPVAAAAIDIAPRRAARHGPRAEPAASRAASGWLQWGGMAAALAVGVLIGPLVQTGPPATGFAATSSALVATGSVADALSNRLASEPAGDGSIRLQISFVDQADRYCRTFTTPVAAGMACREGDAWLVQTLLSRPNEAPQPTMRQAASALPTELLQMVDSRISGDALDARGEQAARHRNWRR